MNVILKISLIIFLIFGSIFGYQEFLKYNAEKKAEEAKEENEEKNEEILEEKEEVEEKISENKKEEVEKIEKKEEEIKEVKIEKKIEEVEENLGKNLEERAGRFLDLKDFSWDDVQNEDTIVLDFYTSWCPSCVAFGKNVSQNLEKIPKNFDIVKVDFDTQKDLAKKYGVTYQHTFVQVDRDGNLIKKWSGGRTLEDFLDNVK